MKKLIVVICVIVLMHLISHQAEAQIDFKIVGELTSSFKAPSLIVYTLSRNSYGYEKIRPGDTISIKEGKFTYKNNKTKPELLQLDFNLDGNQMSTYVFVTGGDIRIKVLDNHIQINGNKDAMDFQNIVEPVIAFNDKVNKFSTKLKTAKKNNTPDSLMIEKQMLHAINSCFQVPHDFIKSNPQSLVSIQALYMIGKGKGETSSLKLADVEQLFLAISPSVRNTVLGRQYAAELEEWKKKIN